MGIISDLIKDFQNRPRIFDFRTMPGITTATTLPRTTTEPMSSTRTEEPFQSARGNLPTNELPKNPVAVARELGSPGEYPITRPEFENVTDPYEWHQRMVNDKIAEAQAYANQKSAEMTINKIGNIYTPDPPKIDNPAANLTPNVYNSSVRFR